MQDDPVFVGNAVVLEYGIVKLEKDRHISWYTKDGLNTYDVRLKRAECLVNHARSLGLTHYLSDVAIEKKDQLLK